MNELIKISYNESDDKPTVSGRELHEALEIGTEYAKWIERMCEYGFSEGEDYSTILTNRVDGKAGKPRTDHSLTIPMAKELCMLQRNERGRMFRKYFIEIENRWNDPEAVMARALKLADTKILKLKSIVKEQEVKIETLENEAELLSSEVLEWADRNTINAIVRRYAACACNNDFASAWTTYKKELLYKYGINLNARITNSLNSSHKKVKPKTLDMLDDSEVLNALKTAVSLCRESKVDISGLLDNSQNRRIILTTMED